MSKKTKNKEIATMESMADLWEEDIRNQTKCYELTHPGSYNTNLEEVVSRGRHAILEGDGDTKDFEVIFVKLVPDEEDEEE